MKVYHKPASTKSGSYAYYTKGLTDTIAEIKENVETITSSRSGIHFIIRKYLPELSIRGELELDNVTKIVGRAYDTSKLEYKIKEFISEDGFANQYVIIRYIRQIVKYNNKLLYLNHKLRNYTAFNVPPVLFNMIVQKMFYSIATRVMKGYSFSFGHGIGYVTAFRKRVDPKITLDGDYTYKINFGETNKKKAKLLSEGVKEEDLWSSEKYNGVVDELVLGGMNLIDAKFAAKNDPRSGIPYAVFCNEDFNYWVIFKSNRGCPLKGIKGYMFRPAQRYLRRFQTYAKALEHPEIVYTMYKSNSNKL